MINYPQLSFEMVEPAFKVFIVYENLAACRQAEKIQDLLKKQSDDEHRVFSIFWNFALFRDAKLRRHATQQIAEADMIIISMHGMKGLPLQVKGWIDQWPAEVQQGALVTLLNPGQELRAEQKSHIDYLRTQAENRGLEFFCNLDDWSRFLQPQPAKATNRHTTMMMPNLVREESWGSWAS